MKKIYILPLVLALINILCCCDKAKDIVLPQTSPYSGHCLIKFSEDDYEADISSGDGGRFMLSFTKPEEIEGLTVSWSGEGMLIEFCGMEWAGGSGDYPTCAIAAAIKNCFAAANTGGSSIQSTSDGNFVIQGGADSGDYKLTLDSDGLPKTLDLPSAELNVAFVSNSQSR